MASDPELKRHLGLGTLTLYGVGVIVGAGIYVLIGRVAGLVGGALGVAFLGAALVALPTGLSYAELASRYPKSAGEAVFVSRATGRDGLAFMVGYLVLASGVASVAAVSHGFANYLGEFVTLPPTGRALAMVLMLAVLSGINFRGIEASTQVNIVCTTVSVLALVVIVGASIPLWSQADLSLPPNTPTGSGFAVMVAGTALAFYGYIGFEDMCNVAEEVHEAERTLPRAIVVAMIVVALLYTAVGIAVVAVVPPAELAASEVPLALVTERLFPKVPSQWLSFIALFAVTNTALFNLIMGSRILYGMGRQGWVPSIFAVVHPKTHTPTWSVATMFVLTTTFALTGFLQVLAEATNTIILMVFFAVNVSLLCIRWRGIGPDNPSQPVFRVPLPVPLLGALTTAYGVVQFSGGAYLRAAALVAIGVVLYTAHRATRSSRTKPRGLPP